jgi:predicted Kef-type K+ transport protein
VLESIQSWAIALASGIAAMAALSLLRRYFSQITSLRIHLKIFTGLALSTASLLARRSFNREQISRH